MEQAGSLNETSLPEGALAPDELENAIEEVWKEIFRRERIDREDNFFELGGNSVIGMDMSELLTTRLALQIPVLTIFQYPTIRELAEIISADMGS